MRKKLNYENAPAFNATYRRFINLALMNPEGYLNKIYRSELNNVVKMFIAMLITCNSCTNTDILIKGKEFYDNYFSY